MTLPSRAALAGVLMSMWAGAGIFFAATVARAAFAILPSRALAGALVGRLLPVIFLSGLLAGMLAFGLVVRRWERAAAAGVVAMCVAAQFLIAPRIAALRERMGPSLDALAVTDPLRQSFGRLHMLSVLLLGVALLCALAFLVALARPRPPAPGTD